jgi:translation initiation factor IF-2
MLSEEEEEELIAGSEVGSVPGSDVGMVRMVPDESEVVSVVVGMSVSESESPAEKLQASETSRGSMRARRGILELRDIFTP